MWRYHYKNNLQIGGTHQTRLTENHHQAHRNTSVSFVEFINPDCPLKQGDASKWTFWLISNEGGNNGSKKIMVHTDLDTKYTKRDDEFATARDTFVKGFLRNHGPSLSKLCFSACTTLKEPNLTCIIEDTIQCMISIKDLEDIVLKYANNLYNLDFRLITLLRDVEKVVYHDARIMKNILIRLRLYHSWIDSKALSELVLNFPKIKHLCIDNSILFEETASTTIKITDNLASINLLSNTLDILSLIWSGGYTGTWLYQYTKLQLKITNIMHLVI